MLGKNKKLKNLDEDKSKKKVKVIINVDINKMKELVAPYFGCVSLKNDKTGFLNGYTIPVNDFLVKLNSIE